MKNFGNLLLVTSLIAFFGHATSDPAASPVVGITSPPNQHDDDEVIFDDEKDNFKICVKVLLTSDKEYSDEDARGTCRLMHPNPK